MMWRSVAVVAAAAISLVACTPAPATRLPDEVHVIDVPEAPGMVCFVDRERRPFQCSPLWVVLEAQWRVAQGM
jgi:hypothetical protein